MSNTNDEEKKLKENISWVGVPPPPLPGMYYIEPKINRDFTFFDEKLEEVVPKRIYTNLIDILGIDFMGLVLEHNNKTEEPKKESWLRKPDQISEEFFTKQEKRSEILKRERIKENMAKLFDYNKYIQESFDEVENILHPIDQTIEIEEVYDVFPDIESEVVVIQSNIVDLEKGTSFNIEEEGPSKLFGRVFIEGNDNAFTCLPQRVNDYLVFNIKDGKAYYSDVSTYFKIQEYKNKTKKVNEKSESDEDGENV